MLLLVIVVAALAVLVGHNGAFYMSSHPNNCVQVPKMCYKLISDNYTHMRLPNMLNHTRKEDVSRDIALWDRLLQSRECNRGNQLKYFLCFTYAPVCVGNKAMDQLILPCRSMCESVRHDCEPVMKQHNYSWPSVFDCDMKQRFYEEKSQMCIRKSVLVGIQHTNAKKTSSQKCSCKKNNKLNRLKPLICKSHFIIQAKLTSKGRVLSKSTGRIQIRVNATKRPLRFTSKMKTSPRSLTQFRKLSQKMTLFYNTRDHCKCHRVVKKRTRAGNYCIIGRKHQGELHIDAIFKCKDDFANALGRKSRNC